MSTRLSHRLTYDAPLTRVAEMLRDPAFRDAVCARQRVLSNDVTIEVDGEASTVVVTRQQAVEGIPSFATKFVGDTITIVSTETWRDHTQGTYEVGIPDKPGHIAGTVTLREEGGVTVETVDLQVKVSIPLVGSKLEKVVAELLEKALRVENEVGIAHLNA